MVRGALTVAAARSVACLGFTPGAGGSAGASGTGRRRVSGLPFSRASGSRGSPSARSARPHRDPARGGRRSRSPCGTVLRSPHCGRRTGATYTLPHFMARVRVGESCGDGKVRSASISQHDATDVRVAPTPAPMGAEKSGNVYVAPTLGAVGAPDAGETVLEEPTVERPPHLLVNETPWRREAICSRRCCSAVSSICVRNIRALHLPMS